MVSEFGVALIILMAQEIEQGEHFSHTSLWHSSIRISMALCKDNSVL